MCLYPHFRISAFPYTRIPAYLHTYIYTYFSNVYTQHTPGIGLTAVGNARGYQTIICIAETQVDRQERMCAVFLYPCSHFIGACFV